MGKSSPGVLNDDTIFYNREGMDGIRSISAEEIESDAYDQEDFTAAGGDSR